MKCIFYEKHPCHNVLAKRLIKLISGVSELSWHLWSWRSAKIVQVKDLSFEVFLSSHMYNYCVWGSNKDSLYCAGVTWKSWKILTWVKESQDISPCYLRWTKIHLDESTFPRTIFNNKFVKNMIVSKKENTSPSSFQRF